MKRLFRFPILSWAAFLLGLQANAAVFFVSPQGNDLHPGTRNEPFLTLERARSAVRDAKKSALPDASFTIWLRDGDYIRTNALELSSEDSGTPSAPLIWQAWSGESPRLLGGRKINGFHPVTNPSIIARLPEPARDQVLQLELRPLGIRDFGQMKSRGFGRPRSPAHCELFYAGKPMTLAQWPNVGQWERIAGFPEKGGEGDGHGGKIGNLQNGFFYAGDRPRQWQDVSDLWVHGYWSWDWANSYERVLSLDLEQRLIRTASPHGHYGFRKGQRFYFLNVLEELDQPGEWFLDRSSGVLYFWPPSTPERDAEVLLSLLAEPLVRVKGARHVQFRGLRLEAARGSAVEIEDGASNRIAGCIIRNIGNYAVEVRGGAGHQVIGCDIFDTGDGGVSLQGGDRKTLSPAGHWVENCHFARQGRWSKCYVPAILIEGVGSRAAHNLIHDHPHCAILFGGNDHVIEYNDIHHIALETGDVGAIYTGRDYTYRGNVIRHNFIHKTGGVGMGSMGVYMDDCVSGTEIYGNVFYKVQRAAFLGGGRDHQVINNIFVDCNYAVELDGRGLDGSPVWRGMVDKTMRGRLAQVPLQLYRERYPAMKSLDRYYGAPGAERIEGAAFKGVPPEHNVVARNLSVGKWLHVYWHATPDLIRLEDNLTNANASFVGLPASPKKPTDFALKNDPEVRPVGFKDIPLDRIGLYRDEFRLTVPAD